MPHKDSEIRKAYHRKYAKQHYKDNKQYYRDKKKRYQERIKEWFRELKSNLKCECGENHPACLEFHHKNPNEKEYNIGEMAQHGF